MKGSGHVFVDLRRSLDAPCDPIVDADTVCLVMRRLGQKKNIQGRIDQDSSAFFIDIAKTITASTIAPERTSRQAASIS